MQIQTVHDQKRGCPCCGEGIKPSRSPRWIKAELIQRECSTPGCRGCAPAKLPPEEKVLLIFIGAGHYPTPEAFVREAARLGISRRLTNGLPREFVIGETWVVLAMKVREADKKGEITPRNKAFMIFRPDRVEYVVDPAKLGEEEYQKHLETMERKGYTLVQVERRESVQSKMFEI